jgi:hypothetical protein
MISHLTGSAASNLGSLGTSTLGLGLNANAQQAQEAQQKLENQKDSVLGKGIADHQKRYPYDDGRDTYCTFSWPVGTAKPESEKAGEL